MGSVELDSELVKRVQQGDKAAFDILVLKYQQKVVNLISRFVSDQSECYDVAQETFIKAYRALGKFRGDSQFYTWLYRIAANTAKNHLASRSRKTPKYAVEVEDAEFTGAAVADRSEQGFEIHLLSQLPPNRTVGSGSTEKSIRAVSRWSSSSSRIWVIFSTPALTP